MTISNPTPRFLASIFKRRGFVDEHVHLFDDVDDSIVAFGIDLIQGEEPVIAVLPSPYNEASWLTTKRFVWGKAGRQKQIALNDIKEISLRVIKDKPDIHSLSIGIDSIDGKSYEICMPDTSVLNGFLAIFHRFTK
jgi:hypothetical protein